MKNKITFLITAAFISSLSLNVNAAKKSSLSKKQTLEHKTSQIKDEVKLAKKNPKISDTKIIGNEDEQYKASLQASIKETEKMPMGKQVEKMLSATRNAHGITVFSSPFIGEVDDFDSSDLLVNSPSINTDLHILKQRKALETYALKHGEEIPSMPSIDLSGSLEMQVLYNDNSYSSNGRSTSDIDLTRAEFDVIATLGNYTTAALLLNYENSEAPYTAISAPGSRANNSRFKVDRAFITFGNLNKCPVYLTMGQTYLPFGKYSTPFVTDPLTKTMGRTKDRPIILGLSTNGLYGSIYGYRGDSFKIKASHKSDVINAGGANIGYKTPDFKGLTAEIGAGYITNIADSRGLQNSVFAISPITAIRSEELQHTVPGTNAYLALNIEPCDLKFKAEYVGTTRSFDPIDLSFNGKGARLSAYDLEAIYNFNIYGKSSNIAIGYDRSHDALGMLLPKQSYFAVFSTSLAKYTVESIEYRHNVSYDHGDIATFGGVKAPVTISSGLSRHQNIVTLQVGVYF